MQIFEWSIIILLLVALGWIIWEAQQLRGD